MDLNTFIYNAQNMPSIPEVVQDVIQSFNSQSADAYAVADKISKDQTISAKVLRMANSAKYGGHRQVGSVQEAIVLLGFNALRTLVLASGMTSAFKPPADFDIRAFWEKSFTMASLCKWTAKFAPDVDHEVAFTCGMLSDVGGLLLQILASEEAQAINTAVMEGGDRLEEEIKRLGFTYPEMGAELACRWKFPLEIADGILHQLKPETEKEGYKPYAGIVFIAHYLHDAREEGKDLEALIADFPFEHSAKLGIDKVAITEKLAEVLEIEEDVDGLVD